MCLLALVLLLRNARKERVWTQDPLASARSGEWPSRRSSTVWN